MAVAASDVAHPDTIRELIRLGIDPNRGLKHLHVDHGYASDPEVALDRIAIGITSVGCRDNRSHCGRKAKADEHEREKETEPQRRAAN